MYSIIHVIILRRDTMFLFFFLFSFNANLNSPKIGSWINPSAPPSVPASIFALKGTITKFYAAASCKFFMIKWCLWVVVEVQKVWFKCQKTHHLALQSPRLIFSNCFMIHLSNRGLKLRFHSKTRKCWATWVVSFCWLTFCEICAAIEGAVRLGSKSHARVSFF